MRSRRVAAVLVLAAALRPDLALAAPRTASTAARPLHVSGAKLLDDKGNVVQLRGVNRSSPETLCMAVGRTSYFYGPTDTASVAAMKAWGANALRLPVNEDCWLGRNGLPASGTATDYRTQLATYARTAVAAGLNVVIDVHFGIAGAAQPMLDKAYGATLWRSIATTFKNDKAVLFDLYNEPHDVTWDCWRDGCGLYAGMQELVTAVRSVGGTNPLILTGPSWGNEVSRWLTYRPTDPRNNLVAGVHLYPVSGCATYTCVEERVRPVAAQAPVVVGEFGDTDCAGTFVRNLPAWADQYGIGYLAFTWNVATVPCTGYHLITAWDGTPTPVGALLRDYLQAKVTTPATATGSRRIGMLVAY